MKSKEKQFIGKGSYGCVFEDSFDCKNQSCNKKGVNNDNDIVSKIFKQNKDAVDELEKYNFIKAINVKNKFTPKLIKHCYVNDTFNDSHKIICGFDINKHNYKQIVYNNGGVDLYHLLFSNVALDHHVHLLTLLKNTHNLFYGINKISAQKLIHDDIRLENVLFNVRTNKIYLIDWGFLTNADNIFSTKNLHLLLNTYKYYYFPPEMKIIGDTINDCLQHKKCNTNLDRIVQSDVFIYKFRNIMKNSLKQKLKNQDTQNFNFFFSNKYIKGRKESKLDFIHKINEITKSISNKSNSANTRNELFQKELKNLGIWKKVDVFMLGLVLLITTSVYFDRYPEELIRFDKNVKFYDQVIKLIMLLLNPDPQKRISPKDAEKWSKNLFVVK